MKVVRTLAGKMVPEHRFDAGAEHQCGGVHNGPRLSANAVATGLAGFVSSLSPKRSRWRDYDNLRFMAFGGAGVAS